MTTKNNNLGQPINQSRLIELCIENVNAAGKKHPESFDPTDPEELGAFCYGAWYTLTWAGATFEGDINMDEVVEGVQEGVRKTAAA